MRIVSQKQPDSVNRHNIKLHSSLFLTESKNGKSERGHRSNKPFKMSLPDKPLITIVTVVYNGELFIEETIQSVINQTYDNIEYIIIDGSSNDGTIDIIRKYQYAIDYWVSEKDEGIYDAMNKAINLATGVWINFMNAGDTFYSSNIVSQVFGSENGDEKIIFGNVQIQYSDFSRIKQGGNPAQLWRGMQFCHQSVFINLKYHKLNQFNKKNKIAADLEFFYCAFRDKEKFRYFDLVFSIVKSGGVSDLNRLQTVRASRNAVRNHGASWIVELYYLFLSIDTLFRYYFKKLLPEVIVKKIIQFK